jgi:hypothetical protein
MRNCYAVALLLLILTAIPSINQGQQVGEVTSQEWWINVPSSPLEFKLFPNKRFLGLTNRSTGRVVQFRLGCVIQGRDLIRVVRKATVTKTDLAASGAAGQQFYFKDVSSYAEDRKCCAKENAKLAVVEVNFADGSTWKVNDTSTPSQCRTLRKDRE